MQLVSKRIFDFLISLGGLILLSPFFLIIALLIALESPGGFLFMQWRVGKNGRDFRLYKFRTMKPDSEGKGQLTVGSRDSRITSIGYLLRKYKLDELPQLVNVLLGDMSLVGPRPEVRKYVDLYTPEQLQVLSVKPGITDFASIQYFKESDLLAQSSDPEQTYINTIMPHKLSINMEYVKYGGWKMDCQILTQTILRILHIKR